MYPYLLPVPKQKTEACQPAHPNYNSVRMLAWEKCHQGWHGPCPLQEGGLLTGSRTCFLTEQVHPRGIQH